MQVNKKLEVDDEKIKYERLTDSEKELITENDMVSINQLSKMDEISMNYIFSRSNTPPYNKVILCDINVNTQPDKCPIYYEINKKYQEHVLAVPDYVSGDIKQKILDAINRPVSVKEMEIY